MTRPDKDFENDIPFFDGPSANQPADGGSHDAAPQQAQVAQVAKAEPAKPGGIASRAMAARLAEMQSQNQDALPDYFNGLNQEQSDAVASINGPLLVLAGAGTGKTRVLTTRIGHILATAQAWPSQILAVTFTNKAAREMKERVSACVGETVEGMPWLGTFHSIGAKILRRHAELVGRSSDFTILNTDDQIRLLKQLIRAEGIDDKRWPAKQLANLIDGWKNKALSPEKISEGDARYFGNGKGRVLYQQYQERLKILNACDFGDLLVENIRLFQENPDILADYQNRFRYILVDEYQDTNVAQYLWLRLLCQKKHPDDVPNICCVGDDDQSIYGWRGAEVDNILRFERDFPGAKVIRLERNYRSTEHILGAAAHLITHNEGRLGKTLFTETIDPDASKVIVNAGWDSEEEARSIGEKIEDLQRAGSNLNDIAILVRASFQMREFEDRFVNMGLNYRVIGGPRFYERKEIRDALAYLRVVTQPNDDLAFERIVNTPKRGIGDTTVRVVHDHARKNGWPLVRAAWDLVETEEMKPAARSKLKPLLMDFRRWSEMTDNTDHAELVEIILDESGYTEMWQNDRSADAPGRLENLKELVNNIEQFDSIAGFLEHVSLVMDNDTGENFDAVSLMTLHSAKGLEFEHVFLPGWEEGLFPHQRSLDEGGRSGLEEERRLAYVGITRAKKDCFIWFVSNRRIHGQWQTSLPSRFIEELHPDHVEVGEPSNSYGGYSSGSFGASRFDTSDPFSNSYSSPGWKRAQSRTNNQSGKHNDGGSTTGKWRSGNPSSRGSGSKLIEGELVASSVNTPSSQFTVGDRVFHQKFGNGNITAIDGNKLTIHFDKAGEKRVVDSFIEAI